MKIKPTFPIPTMKIRQIEYYIGFLNSTRWKVRCSLDPKAEAVNKVQRQLRPEPYFPEFFKSQARKRQFLERIVTDKLQKTSDVILVIQRLSLGAGIDRNSSKGCKLSLKN